MAIDPNRDDLRRYRADDRGEPVVMLNLLRFAPGGRERYAEYMRQAAPFLARVGGRVLYAGDGSTTLVAEPGQVWDAVLLVHYPSRTAFLQMVTDPEYQAITHLRAEALADAVLQATTAMPLGRQP